MNQLLKREKRKIAECCVLGPELTLFLYLEMRTNVVSNALEKSTLIKGSQSM
jgi:hypothetical protein